MILNWPRLRLRVSDRGDLVPRQSLGTKRFLPFRFGFRVEPQEQALRHDPHAKFPECRQSDSRTEIFTLRRQHLHVDVLEDMPAKTQAIKPRCRDLDACAAKPSFGP